MGEALYLDHYRRWRSLTTPRRLTQIFIERDGENGQMNGARCNEV